MVLDFIGGEHIRELRLEGLDQRVISVDQLFGLILNLVLEVTYFIVHLQSLEDGPETEFSLA